MDILIDNKKIDFENKKFKSLGLIMDEINKILEREGKMLCDIYVNGRVLTDNQMIMGDKIDVVEVVTQTPKIVILTALKDMKIFIEKYFESLEVIGSEVEIDDDMQLLGSLFEIVGGLEWCNNVLLSIKENTAIDFIDSNFDEILEDFRGCLKGIQDAMNSRDMAAMYEMLEFDMSDILADISDDINFYYENILREELREGKYA
ncbi:hypothetical protein PM10SUCC1_15150 [Propionigenium maris DSM 9537]|uniref:Uncharacterized protein n=1 Tax=Propionigenium maris DSM 9537 TaxID=1123000 RepID=A0A9W6GLM8_9FUSO|nr:hypothetical protein [Propionigenium maris]GLI56001.1 hypothetical protein PM10SUCC1_15150 [Propionigenium maris DSM 9537]